MPPPAPGIRHPTASDLRVPAAGCRPPEIRMKALIRITLKNGVLDPQGKAIEGAVRGLGITGVGDVRQGKFIEVQLNETDEAKAKSIVEQMCKDLLANTVIENYAFDLVP
jgi:phosphoribosylformylglycinamidine synthase